MKLILVLVDALKSSYLSQENMPFLWQLSQKSRYIKRIIPSPGFCERGELFSGLDCFDTGNYSAIGYLPEYSSYGKKERMLSCLRIISSISNKIGKRLVRYYCRKKGKNMRPYLIPTKSLCNFALTEDGDYKLTNYRTLFDVLDENGKSYTLSKFASLSSKQRMSNLSNIDFIKDAIEKKIDFVPIYIGQMDYYGHRYGDDVDQLRRPLKDVDKQIQELYFLAKSANYAFAVLGDHGMVPIKETVDIKQELRKLPFKLGEEYELFIDSTAARFWFFSKDAKTAIETLFRHKFVKTGKIVDKTNYMQYRIPLDIKNSGGIPVYGDLIWMTNPGVLLVPDYFNPSGQPDKGMHGFMELDEKHGTGCFVVAAAGLNTRVIEEAHLYDVCGELCSILNVEKPNAKDWARLVINKYNP